MDQSCLTFSEIYETLESQLNNGGNMAYGECDYCPVDAVLIDGLCPDCHKMEIELLAAEQRKPVNSTVYEFIEHGGNVHDDIADMTLDEMEDYFGDTDPIAFL